MTKTLDDKLREILEQDSITYRGVVFHHPVALWFDLAIGQVKQAIADEIRACEPEKKPVPYFDNDDMESWEIEKYTATQNQIKGRNQAISEYTENLTKKGLL